MSLSITKKISFLQAFHSRQFFFLWTGQTVSSIGDGAFNTAVAWQVLTLTGSAVMMGIVMTAQILPMILFLLIGGVAADRLPRKKVMLWSDVSRAMAVLLIAGLAMAHLLQVWHLVALSLLFGTVRGFFMPAYQSLIPQIVEKDDLASANSLTELSYQLYALLGPILGASFVTIAGSAAAFAFDGFTFLVSVLFLLLLRMPVSPQRAIGEAEPQNSVRAAAGELREGFLYVAGSTFLWVTIALEAISSLGAGTIQVALPKLVHDGYGQSIWTLGTIWVAGGLGSLIAIPFIPYLNRLRKRGVLIYLAMLFGGLGQIAFVFPVPHLIAPILACIGMTVFVFSQTAGEVLWITVLQEMVPDDKLGRVNSINQLAAYGLWPVGFLLAGILTDRIGPIWVFLGSGVLIAGLYGLALGFRSIRNGADSSTSLAEEQLEYGEFQEIYQQPTLFPEWSLQMTSPLPKSPSVSTGPLTQKRSAPRRMSFVIIMVALFEVVGAVLLSFLYSRQLGTGSATHLAAPVAPSVGQVAFMSSGQLDPNSTKGLNDTLAVTLHNLSQPAKGQSYYAWLMPDTSDDDTRPLLLGKLDVVGGKVQLTYVEPNHENLLALYSGFEVAEQPGGQDPLSPPIDPKALPYVGSIPNIAAPTDEKHYSLLSHLRHLLAKDPTIEQIGLQGGLDIWCYRNSEKILEWSSAARDNWTGGQQTDLIHRHMIRVLDYLDGTAYVSTSGAVPISTPLLVDPKVGRFGLLEVSPTQQLPAYLTHIDGHLQGIVNAPGHSQAQLQIAIKIDNALKTDISFFQKVRQDAVKLVKMNDTQLKSNEALSLLNDMVTNANAGYTGQFDSTIGGNTNGISWISYELQALATIPVTVQQ